MREGGEPNKRIRYARKDARIEGITLTLIFIKSKEGERERAKEH